MKFGSLFVVGAFATMLCTVAVPGVAHAAPEGKVTIASHATVVPAWFNPSEYGGAPSPFIVYYGLHDALVKPMPEGAYTPCLAESWTKSEDGSVYEFKLRPGLTFHNGDPLTSEDVKFSFDRYVGTESSQLKSRVASFETPDPLTVRIRLKAPWPDFMLYYSGLRTTADFVLPKAYITRVGDDEFKRNPIGAGPYRFVSMKPGEGLVMEAFEKYVRKVPLVKTFVIKSVPDILTRAAMLKTGEADIAFSFLGATAEELRRTNGISLVSLDLPLILWLNFSSQWDPQSPWSKKNVREAVNYALDRKGIAEAEYLGFATSIGTIVPPSYDFYKPLPPYAFDPKRAKQLLAEAGYPDGFDGGDFHMDTNYASVGEIIQSNLQAIGIKLRLRPLERAAYYDLWSQRKLPGLVFGIVSTYDNAGTYLDQFITSNGSRSFGTYPGIDELMKRQAAEVNETKRAAMLDEVQIRIRDEVMYAPILNIKPLFAYGPRIDNSGLAKIKGFSYVAPMEEVKLKADRVSR